jgi:hypothetical protein
MGLQTLQTLHQAHSRSSQPRTTINLKPCKINHAGFQTRQAPMSWFHSTRATESRCPRCQAATLTAHDEGIPVTINAAPLTNRNAEIIAIADGLNTYWLTQTRQIIYRNATRITGTSITGTIHAAHKCAGPQQTLIFDFLEQK